MSEILDAIKVWEQQNASTIKGLDVAKQNAISQALNFFNKKFGGEGELMPIIEEPIVEAPIVEQQEGLVPIKLIRDEWNNKEFTSWSEFNKYIDDYYKIAPLPQIGYDKWKFKFVWEDGSLVVERFDMGLSDGDFNPKKENANEYLKKLRDNRLSAYYDISQNFDSSKLSFYDSIDKEEGKQNELYKVNEIEIRIDKISKKFQDFEDARTFLIDYFKYEVNQKPFIFNIIVNWADGSAITSRNDIKVDDFALDSYNPIVQPLSRYIFVLYVLGKDKDKNNNDINKNFFEFALNDYTSWDWQDSTLTSVMQEVKEEISDDEEEVVFADLEAIENEIESINFEELEKVDTELDDLF